MLFRSLLKCADGTLYCGCTNNLTKRLAAHNRGQGAKYTRSRRPVALAWQEEQPDRSAALRREAQVKKLSRAQKLALSVLTKNEKGESEP